MGRNRVLSFMSQFSAQRDSKSPTPTSSPPRDAPLHATANTSSRPAAVEPHNDHFREPQPPFVHRPSTPTDTSPPHRGDHESPVNHTPARQRSNSRPLSLVMTYQPPMMDIGEDTIPELQPIFTFLNSHGNKLYHEGYFLKLDDQNTQGRPNPDRTWTECFAQLVGTVLSLWDAAELDAAGEDGEVLPKFINLTDASIKMIESLPTRSEDEQPLQNILSISTAGRNRYLLHFSSHHSLIQWTAAIRLAMHEHATLQEAYTGALIAGKGKSLNNINVIMERSRMKTEEWVRVRFGAGVPWRRCWCVISPPDEKEYQKQQKELKKRSPYDRSHIPVLKGDIKFYDSKKEGKKQKKARPIASITDAYSAYAIYPQAKSLIDGSTLLKVEGNITIHSDPPSSTEGFVFVMPETHPMVSGFEMLLRFLFPTWDTFGLYGRPGKLVASVLDPRSLMFAMPKHKRYGYLEILDVAGLIHTDGSSTWTERDWRKRLKELTGQRMNSMDEGSEPVHRRSSSRKSNRLSFGASPHPGASKPRVGFADDSTPLRTSRSFSLNQRGTVRNDSAPPTDRGMGGAASHHARNSSDPNAGAGVSLRSRNGPGYGPPGDYPPSRGPAPSPSNMRGILQERTGTDSPDAMNSDDERVARSTPVRELEGMRRMETPEPVSRPPAFNHGPQSRPGAKAYHSPELRRANSRLSHTTLSQLAKAGGVDLPHEAYADESAYRNGQDADPRHPVHPNVDPMGISANDDHSREALISPVSSQSSSSLPPSSVSAGSQRSRSPFVNNGPRGPADGSRPPHNIPLPHLQGQPMGASPDHRVPLQGTPPLRGPPPHGPPPQGPQPHGPPPQAGPQRPYHGNFGPNQGRRTPPAGQRGPSPGPNSRGGGYRPNPRSPPQGPSGLQNEYFPPQNMSGPVHRKPVPQQMGAVQRAGDVETPQSPSSAESFKTNMLDQVAMAQIRPQGQQQSPMPQRPAFQRQDSTQSASSSHYADNRPGGTPMVPGGLGLQRQGGNPNEQGNLTPEDWQMQPPPRQEVRRQDSTMSSSQYSDGDSTTSPDYASTRKSTDTATSVERPRAGVLKTVGGGEVPPMPTLQHKTSAYSVPDVDFGPTINYPAQPAKAPSPAGSQGPPPPVHLELRRPYSPGARPGHSETGHARQDSNDTVRRVAWQPGGATAGSGGQGLSAEQFVQQRAAAAPLYSHARSPSGNTLGRSTTPTPSMSRNVSQEAVHQRHSRSSSAELLQRPSSQGGMSGFNTGSTGDVSSHLSAREQEQVARMTGTPLISMPGNRPAPPGGGLVGAIEAREREKQQVKQGMNSQAVQHAINQRQQAQAQAQAQAAYAYQQQQFQQQPQMYNAGRGNVDPQAMYHASMARGHGPYGPQGQQPGPYGPPMGGSQMGGAMPPQGYPQGGRGFTRPAARSPRPQSPAGLEPRMMPPQGQYSPGGGQYPQAGRGQGYPGHGQAF